MPHLSIKESATKWTRTKLLFLDDLVRKESHKCPQFEILSLPCIMTVNISARDFKDGTETSPFKPSRWQQLHLCAFLQNHGDALHQRYVQHRPIKAARFRGSKGSTCRQGHAFRASKRSSVSGRTCEKSFYKHLEMVPLILTAFVEYIS